jgi:enoyl-CoA hydratase
MSTQVKLNIDGAVARITFEDPKGINILSTEVIKQLDRHLDTVKANSAVRALVITGAGKTFLAGADIKEMTAYDPKAGSEFSKVGHACYARLEQMPVVSIAAINGAAMGGGCELALACDLRVAAEGAKIGLPEVSLGLIPGWGGTQRLARIVGPSRARRMIFTGQPLTGAQALQIGLVDAAAPPEQLEEVVSKLLAAILANGPNAVRLAKASILAGESLDRKAGFDAERNNFGAAFQAAESREGLAAFVEKRKPNW